MRVDVSTHVVCNRLDKCVASVTLQYHTLMPKSLSESFVAHHENSGLRNKLYSSLLLQFQTNAFLLSSVMMAVCVSSM